MPNYYEFNNDEWKKLIRTTELNEPFLTCYAPYFDKDLWAYISQYQALTSHFIYRFRHSLSIKSMLSTQRIHQNVILKQSDTYSEHQWSIFKYQYISEEFVTEHYLQLSLDLKIYLELQPHLSLEFIKIYFPIAYDGEYVPKNNYRKKMPIHDQVYLKYMYDINDMTEKHNNHLVKMNEINISLLKNETFLNKKTLK